MIICCCDGSVNRIFTAIYKAWELGTSRTSICVSEGENMELFSEYRFFEADEELARKVADSILRKLSPEIYSQVYRAALSCEADRGEAIYRFLIDAFRIGSGIINHLVNPHVMRLFELNRTVAREAHKYLGFLRFGQYRDSERSFLLARFDPRNNILDLVSHHCADRLMNDNWLIADTIRGICSLHNEGSREYIIAPVTDEYLNALVEATREDVKNASPLSNESIEQLWETFRASIAIEPRRNVGLQQQLMPLRYRTYMNTYSDPAT